VATVVAEVTLPVAGAGCERRQSRAGRPAAAVTVVGSLWGVADYQTPEFHPAFEEYCEAIYELKEDDVDVIQARIADRLMVSRPAVSEMIKRLDAEGLVSTDRGRITLTADGERLAERVVRRHRLAERFLTDMLGLSWADAHKEAGKWEHVISASVEQAIVRVLGDPTTCPHGNPIPGADYTAPEMRPLSEVPVGEGFTVTRIPEELEFAPGLLEFLEEADVVPGRAGTMTAASPDGTTTVEIEGRHIGIGAFASQRILVLA
jgi:DtxR family Mn-dependent transcriptional regulator